MAKRQVFRIVDTSGGVNFDQNPLLMADNEAEEVLNFRLDKPGSLLSRHGYSPYLGLDTGNDNITAVGRWTDGSSPNAYDILVATDTGKIIEYNENTSILTTLKTGLSPNKSGQFLPIGDYVIYANGTDYPVKFDGTTVTDLVEPAPAAKPAVALTTGTLVGDYIYVYTYFNSANGWETNPSPNSDTMSPTSQGVNVTMVAPTHPDITHYRIYRTTDAGATLQYLDQQAIGTGNVYTDDGSQTLASIEVSYDNDSPGIFEHIAYHKGYLFGSIGRTLYWSKYEQFHAFPTVNSTTVPFEGIDKITALQSYEDTLLVFGANNTVLVAGSGGNWALIRQDVNLGATSDRAIAEVPGGVVFLSHEGLRVFPSFQEYAPKLTKVLSDYGPTFKTQASIVHVPEERALWLSIDSETWCIHTRTQAISRYSFYAHQFLRGGKDGYSMPLWIPATSSTSTTRTYLAQYGGHTDNGTDIPIRWRSKIFPLANPEFTKFFRRIGAFASIGSGVSVTVTISDKFNSWTVNLDNVGGNDVIEWDEFLWDFGSWSDEGVVYFIGSLPAQVLLGQVFQVTINATVAEETEIITPISLEYREADRFMGG